jgi:hypothetical protein
VLLAESQATQTATGLLLDQVSPLVIAASFPHILIPAKKNQFNQNQYFQQVGFAGRLQSGYLLRR